MESPTMTPWLVSCRLRPLLVSSNASPDLKESEAGSKPTCLSEVETAWGNALLKLENLVLFCLRDLIELCDLRVRQFLDGVESMALVIIADELVLRQFLQLVVCVPPDVS